jgi:hypothetical protein
MPVVNQSQAAPKVTLVPPDPYGYVFVLAEVDVASVTTDVERVEAVATAPELQSTSRPRAAFQESTMPVRTALSKLPTVRAVSVFEAILFAQRSLDRFAPRGAGVHSARYDSVIVVETTTPAAAESLLSEATFSELVQRVCSSGTWGRVFPAANVKKIASVDRSKGGEAFRSPNYWNFVLANIDANRATAMPSLYRLLG